MDLDTIKRTVESFSKKHQLGVLKIIKENDCAIINENKSGVYINMTFLSQQTIEKIRAYIVYVRDQENILNPIEYQKEDFKNTFFLKNSIETS
jgi:hypothetical protein